VLACQVLAVGGVQGVSEAWKCRKISGKAGKRWLIDRKSWRFGALFCGNPFRFNHFLGSFVFNRGLLGCMD
jgi:hypothetical protein